MNGLRLVAGGGIAALCALAAAAASVANGAGQTAAVQKSPREIYLASCAPCHGETGDGKGITVLERPARSFKDGGFSYGNTPEALLRTITHGIPGSLMPSFRDALKEDDRKALAAYVLSLGPPTLKVEAQDTVLVVRDRAVVARGKLPPIVDGAPERPRGLLIGLPSGLSFEYRTDDVRLLGVRSGEFADRTDWVGRGGTVLQPLGKLVRRTADEASFACEKSDAGKQPAAEPLAARLRATTIDGAFAGIEYVLVSTDGKVRAEVSERLAPVTCSLGAGWKRDFTLVRDGETRVRFRALPRGVEARAVADAGYAAIVPAEAGQGHDLVFVRGAAGEGGALSPDALTLGDGLELAPRGKHSRWTVIAVPGVALPEDAGAWNALVDTAAREVH